MIDHPEPDFTGQLRALVQTAQQNERTLRRFQDVELALIRARGFAAFLDILFVRLPRDFGLDAVRLCLDGTCLPLRDLLEPQALAAFGHPELLVDTAVCVSAARLCEGSSPWLGSAGAANGAFAALFASRSTDDEAQVAYEASPLPASAIILPLSQDGLPIGHLCLGSSDGERFAAGMATDILERFASIVAASLDNVAHRERLKRLGMTDALTGLANRRYFDERLREEVLRAGRHGVPVTLLFFDIDHFKSINDTHGHAAGDRALVAVARCARDQLRVSDTLARYGGEEFAALLVQIDRTSARVVAERVRQAVAALDVRDDDHRPMRLTVSIGIATQSFGEVRDVRETARVVQALVDEADRAMYRAKHDGRNRVQELD